MGAMAPCPDLSCKEAAMRHRQSTCLLTFVLMLPLLAMPAMAGAEEIKARLIGFQEVPSVATVARGEFTARITDDDQSIDYELEFNGLQAPVTQSHIHVAQKAVNGSIVVWLCGTASNPGPAGTQTCPQSGTISGTITPANVVAGSITSQQLLAGNLAEVIRAIRGGVAYANVHTTLSPGGEIRGQIRASEDSEGSDR